MELEVEFFSAGYRVLLLCCIGVENGGVGVNYGVVEYWVRWKVPMDQALRLYKVSTVGQTSAPDSSVI